MAAKCRSDIISGAASFRERVLSEEEQLQLLTACTHDEIVENLFLGGSYRPIEARQYDFIVQVCPQPCDWQPEAERFAFPLRKNADGQLGVGVQSFDVMLDALRDINRRLVSRQRVLVHCQAGVDRSATVVAAFIVCRFGVDGEMALRFVRHRRYIAEPRDEFREYLLRDFKPVELLGDLSVMKMPQKAVKSGRWVRLEPLEIRHADSIWRNGADDASLYRWLPAGPFKDLDAFTADVAAKIKDPDFVFFAIVDTASGEAWGWGSIMRIDLRNRVCEIGWLLFTKRLQRTRQASEAFALFAAIAFDEMGARRYEWKCNTNNDPSRLCALRLGFTFEGVFRQHMISKGENRDSAWFSILDKEYFGENGLRARYQRYLREENFDEHGSQKKKLSDV